MTLDTTSVGSVLALLIIISVSSIYMRRKRQLHPYPPGPSGLPLLANLLDFPTSVEWITYEKWCKDIGSDIVHASALGMHVVVLNSLQAIEDLLEKRSSIYSSRPRFPMTVEMMGCDWTFALIPYGQAWRERRRMFAQYFHPANVEGYQENHIAFVRSMLPGLLDRPHEYLDVIRYAISGSALSLAYGLPIKAREDPYIDLAQTTISKINASVLPTNFLVNLIPSLMYIPDFIPGAGFKRKAKEWRVFSERLISQPFNTVIDRMKTGTVTPSFTSALLDNLDTSGTDVNKSHDKKVIMDVAASIFVGAADTTLAIVSTFIAAMLLFPDAQRKAQQELDRVLNGRLPDFNDEPDLPYITALVKEVIRWSPITPVAAPHTTTEDDVYKGYFIPKGTIIIPNSWSLLHDEVYYPDPSAFKPERFLKDGKLNPDIRDPTKIIFGYGRRVCPGSHIGLSFFFLTVSTILATFNISEEVDKSGNAIEPSVEWHSGVICEPAPFNCTIKPRSREATELIHNLDSKDVDHSR